MVGVAHTHCRGDSRIARGSIVIDPYLLFERSEYPQFIIHHLSFIIDDD